MAKEEVLGWGESKGWGEAGRGGLLPSARWEKMKGPAPSAGDSGPREQRGGHPRPRQGLRAGEEDTGSG